MMNPFHEPTRSCPGTTGPARTRGTDGAGGDARTCCGAFTLVELLVVTGIIALLIGVLLPALNVAQEQAKTVQCLSNLRQVMVAAQVYVEAHKGSYPLASYSGTHGPLQYNYQWDFTTIFDTNTGTWSMVPGLIWSGKTNLRIQQCPSYEGPSMTAGGTYDGDPYTGYNYNTSYVGGEFVSSLGTYTRTVKASQIRKPAETAVFGDGAYRVGTGRLGANKFMRAPLTDPQASDAYWNAAFRYAGTQDYRHRRATNVAYADGHAATVTDRFNDDLRDVAVKTGFLSVDNTAYDLK